MIDTSFVEKKKNFGIAGVGIQYHSHKRDISIHRSLVNGEIDFQRRIKEIKTDPLFISYDDSKLVVVTKRGSKYFLNEETLNDLKGKLFEKGFAGWMLPSGELILIRTRNAYYFRRVCSCLGLNIPLV